MAAPVDLKSVEDVKLNRICESFPGISRDIVLNIFTMCKFEEEKTRSMLAVFQNANLQRPYSAPSGTEDSPAEPKPETLNKSLHSVSSMSNTVQLPVKVLEMLLNSRGENFDGTQSMRGDFPHPAPNPMPVFYPRHPAFYPPMSRFPGPYPAYPQQYRPPPPPSIDISEVLRKQQDQLQTLTEEVKRLKDTHKDLLEKGKNLESSINEAALLDLQGITNEQLEDKRIVIQTLEYDNKSLEQERDRLLECIRSIQPPDQGEEPSQAQVESVWRCKICTYDNKRLAVMCCMCGFKKGSINADR